MKRILAVVLAAAAAAPARAGMASVEPAVAPLPLSAPAWPVEAGQALAPALAAPAPSAGLFVPSLSAPAAFAAAPAAPAAALAAPAADETPAAAAPVAAAASAADPAAFVAAAPAFSRGTAAAGAAAAAGELDARVVFDGARTQAAAAPVADEPSAPGLSPAGRAAPTAARMAGELIPAWASEELPIASARLGRPLTPEEARGVLARTNVWVYRWHSYFTYEVSGGLPDGHYDPRFGIRLMLKMNWRRLKDPQTHFRVLMAHEYTHWLQNEGVVSRRYGGEIAAVAVELLRGVELVGLDGLKRGRVDFIHQGVLGSFEDGRRWARGGMADESILYHRGALGGAAYEVGLIAGRPEAAWEFLNLVIAQRGALSPREAFARVTGRAK